MLFCKHVTKSFGAQSLLTDVSFQLNPGERIGVVGRNGSGKSTLVRLIVGQDEPDEGEIAWSDNYRLGALDQHLSFTKPTIVAEVAQVLPPDQSHDRWRAEKLLSGLGFSAENFDQAPSEFSGGFQIRVKLAQLLLSEPDLLLLDEPTNYLDIVAIRWLENFLRSWKGEMLCISHDHDFLERVMTHTMIVHRRKLKKVKGSPQKLYDQIAQEEAVHERTRLAQSKEQNRQEKFIREFRSGARSAGLVQSRIKMLEKQKSLDALQKVAQIEFNFPYRDSHVAKLLEAKNLSFGYEKGIDLLKKVSVEIFPREKIGIIGANGKGKSTLLRVLTGQLKSQSGTLKTHPQTKIGYFGQSNLDRLEAQRNILEELQSVGDVSEQTVRSVAGNLLFAGDLAYKKVQILSGGEKARVNLGKILLSPTNLLLLDEPTNHLDYESVQALIEAIKKYEGAVVFVAHDEYFLRNTAEKLIVFDGDEVKVFPGTYDQFLAEKGFLSEQEMDSGLQKSAEKSKSYRDKDAERAYQREVRKLKKKLKDIEKTIQTLEDQQVENKEKFKIAERQGNRLKLDTLGIEYQELHAKVLVAMEKWETVGEELEQFVAKNEV